MTEWLTALQGIIYSVIAAWPVVISLVILESLLSVDNALVLAEMVRHLPGKQQVWALRAGMLGAYVMRGLSLAFVYVIINNGWIEMLAGAYLIYLASKHLGNADQPDEHKKVQGGFIKTVVMIELMDLSFSIDNVAAAAAFSDNFYVICAGVFIGIAAMRFIAQRMIKVIDKFPVLGHIAYVLIGAIGVQLCLEFFLHTHYGEMTKFLTIIGIIGGGIIYDRVKLVNKLLTPVFDVCQKVMKVFAAIIDGFFGIIGRICMIPLRPLLKPLQAPVARMLKRFGWE